MDPNEVEAEVYQDVEEGEELAIEPQGVPLRGANPAESTVDQSLSGDEGGEAPAEGEKPVVPPNSGDDLRLTPQQWAQLQAAQNPAAAPQQKQLSEDEINKILQPVKITADHMQALGFDEPDERQIKAMQAIIDQTVNHATQIQRAMIAATQQQFTQQLSPIQEYYAAAQRDQAFEQFFGKYENLRPYKQIVATTVQQMLQENPALRQLPDEQIGQKVAARTIQFLQSAGIDPTKAAKPSATPGAAVPKPQKFAPAGRSQQTPPGGGIDNPDADIYR